MRRSLGIALVSVYVCSASVWSASPTLLDRVQLPLTGATSALLDPSGNYVYVSHTTDELHHTGGLSRVQLSDLSASYTRTIAAGAPTDQFPMSFGDVALLDPPRNVAYYSYDTVGAIVRVSLPDLTETGRITLGGSIRTGVIDPAGGYAYFMIGIYNFDWVSQLPTGGNAQFIKVRLSDFSIVSRVNVPNASYAGKARQGDIDTSAGVAYMTALMGASLQTQILKVRLSDMQVIAHFDAVGNLHPGVIDASRGVGYYSLFQSGNDYVVKLRLSDMTEVSRSQHNNIGATAAALDPARDAAYLGETYAMNTVDLTNGTITETILSIGFGEVVTFVPDPARPRLYLLSRRPRISDGMSGLGPSDVLRYSLDGATPGDTQKPTAPGSPTATALSTTQIKIAWTPSTDNVGVTGYRVLRAGVQITDVNATTFQFTDSGLVPSTAYSYTVVAYDAAGNISLPSASVSTTTLTAAVAPTITVQPVDRTVTAGQTATFSITASGTTPLTYQWQKVMSGSSTFNAIAGATSASYTTAVTILGDNGSQYRCVVTNSTGTATSNPATLTVNPLLIAPTITAQPSNQTVIAGQTATFSITASGTDPLTYQWQKAISGSSTFNIIAGATSASYTTAVTIVGDIGSQYRCVVTNSTGTATSNPATLTVSVAPVAPTITSQPTNQTVTAGQTAAFSITASGTASLSYQWQKALSGSSVFNPITGATSASYTTAVTIIGDSGTQYRCVVTNSTGTATSNPATLTVNAAPIAPTITVAPTNQTVTAGQTATFNVTASGTTPLSYQWQRAVSGSNTFNPIAGATSITYTTAVTLIGDNGSRYRCVVTNVAGNVTSIAATLTVSPLSLRPTVTAQPLNQTVTAGQTATFGVAATGTAPLSYQWQMAASGSVTYNPILGATSPIYTTPLTGLGDNGSQYRCVISNGAGNVTSNSARLTVNAVTADTEAPTIPAQVSATALSVAQIQLTWSPSSDNVIVMGYRVFRNDIQVGDVTTPAFTDSALQAQTSYDYTVEAYDSSGNRSAKSATTTASTLAPELPPNLAAPTLELPAYLSLKGTLVAHYPDGYGITAYRWTLEFVSASRTSSSHVAASRHAGAISASFQTSASHADLGSQTLTPGYYRVGVRAVDQHENESAEAQGYVTLRESALDRVRLGPNPWRADQHLDKPITFRDLPINATIKLFTVSGQLIKTLSSPTGDDVEWNCTNDSGDKVASGLYFYILSDDTGGQRRGKLTIIK